MPDVTDATIDRTTEHATDLPEGSATAAAVPVPSFSDFPIHEDIVAALAEHHITSPFPIQAMTLPVALSGHDIIGQAKTGTGKTLGFGIPILNRVVSPRDNLVSSAHRCGGSLRRPASCRCPPPQFLEIQHDRFVRPQQVRQDLLA